MEHKLRLSLCPFQVFHFIPQDLLANTDLSMCAELTLQPLLSCPQSSLAFLERNVNIYTATFSAK